MVTELASFNPSECSEGCPNSSRLAFKQHLFGLVLVSLSELGGGGGGGAETETEESVK